MVSKSALYVCDGDRVTGPASSSDAWPGTLGELAASIAHEANQPLAAIVTNGGTCLRWLAQGEADLERARENVTAMTESALRLSHMIRGLCALVTRAGPRTVTLDLNEVIEESLPLIVGEMSRNRVSLELDLASEPPAVLGDPVQLQQVVLNLVSNGIEAMASNDDRARLLRIRSRHNSTHAIVRVQDEGTGLEGHSIGRLFNGFYTTKANGMGIGLTICRSIIEAHGGQIWASPNPDHGASFHFALPLARMSE
jgi:C4-dicarboxylate-specific signal transduction histidine kinase